MLNKHLYLLKSEKKPTAVTNDSKLAPDYKSTDVVCHCMSIKRGEVSSLIKRCRGSLSLDMLIGRSGAGSVCTCCHPLLKEMMGERIWSDVTVTAINSASKDSKTYRFENPNVKLFPAKAGQHIAVQAYINGCWELRRYTLTTPAEETSYREITVKKITGGKFSSWLHSVSKTENLIRISQPLGTVTPELVSSKSLICFVGGIGVTPVLSMIRSINKNMSTSREIMVDYSAKTDEQLIYKDEIQEIVNCNKNVSVKFRVTHNGGNINYDDILSVVKNNPDSQYYICGPTEYANNIIQYLHNTGVQNDDISLEYFNAPEQNKISSPKNYYYIGLFLFFLFALQQLSDFRFDWLENLQSTEIYKIYSGLFLAGYILSQFILPYNKSSETPHVTAKFYQRHKMRGAFAPLVFYFHATHFGVGYLLLLASVFFANFLLGIFNHERIKQSIKRVAYFKYWLPTHIALSVLLLGLAVFHIYVVASY